jgi:Concanavalin A-like lectin/glucanases superfamily/Immunoglobulin I-set domain
MTPKCFARLLLAGLGLLICCQSAQAAYLTSTNIQGSTPASWTVNSDWQTNTAVSRPGLPANQVGPKIAAAIGNDYEMISNGVAITNGTGSPNVTFIRTPGTGPASTFPGLSLTLDTNTVLMYKGANNQIDTYTNLILKGGVICKALGGTGGSTAVITGAVQVVSQTYLSSGTDRDRVANPSTVAEVFNIAATLSGSGNLFIMNFITNAPNIISGGTRNLDYHGTFVVQCGALLGSNVGSLGTNSSVIIDPSSTLYKADMPNVTATVNGPGKAVFEAGYAYNTAGTLTITNGGVMNLHQHCAFSAVTIEGVALSPGDHTYSELIGNFPNSFLPGGADVSASLTVQAYNPNWVYGPPVILKGPESISVYSGGMIHFSPSVLFAFSYQWLSNGIPLTAETNSTLSYGSGSADLFAGVNYALVAINSAGSTTSSVASVSIRTPVEPVESAVAALTPYAFYQLNELNDPATTLGGATAFDTANSFNGLYGVAVQNGNAIYSIAGPVPSTDGLTGFDPANTAGQFVNNTANSVLTLPSLGLNTNTVTITSWINPNVPEAANTGIFFCRGGSSIAGFNYGGVFDPTLGNYPLTYNWNNDPATYNWSSGILPPANLWSLVALVVTPTNATIYLLNTNGLVSSQHIYPHAVVPFNGTTLIGGDSLGINRTFSGRIDDVAVFNKALTRDQLFSMFYAASGQTAYAPVIQLPPTSQLVYAGQTATFTVVGGGSAPLTYDWQVDTGSGFADVSGGQYSGANSPILTIANTTPGNTANYQVILSNASGAVTSSVVSLSVSSTSAGGNITMSIQQASGANWDNTAAWSDGLGATDSSVQKPGSTYELLPGSRMRTPVTNTVALFPGIQLTVDGNGIFSNNPAGGAPVAEVRLKPPVLPVNNTSITFNKMIMNGGQVDLAPDAGYTGTLTLGGEIDILTNAPFYNDGTGGDGVGIYMSAYLNGSGSFEYHGNFAGSIPLNAATNNLNIANPTNNFSGVWNVVSGILLGSAPGSLGTNTIIIGSQTSTNAALETAYDINDPNATLFVYGQIFLHQNDTFKSVFINGVPLTNGTYSFATLNTAFPGTFPATWTKQTGSSVNTGSGQIVVLTSPLPAIVSQPQSVSVYPGQQTVTFSASAAGTQPLSYQWYTNGTFALSDNANRIGSISNVLTIPIPAPADGADYTLVVTNVFGAVTSSVATLTVLTPGPGQNFTLDFGGTPTNQATGQDWNTANNWNPGGQAASFTKFSNPGSTYEVVVGSRLRTPAGTNFNVFPGDQLTVDGSGIFENNTLGAVGEFRFKNNSDPATTYFKKLVLNGGQLDNGDSVLEIIQGELNVLSTSTIYIDSAAAVDRSFQIDALLSGSGDLLWHEFSGGLDGADLLITGTGNTFTGQWIIDQGAVVAAGANSLGTNNINVGVSGLNAALETLYDIHDPAGSLTLGPTGQLFLHQNDSFASVTVNGTPLANGVYTFAQLNGTYPANFPATWTPQAGSPVNTGSGSLTVGVTTAPVVIQSQFSAGSLTLNWSQGTLLQATNVTGPWVTNGSTPPYSVMPATNGPQMFYRILVQ